jgi:hypothetical protein
VFVFFHGILNGFLDGFLWDFGNFRLDRLGRNWGLEAANWNLGASLPELLAIARRATQEHYVEVALEKLKETWSHSAFGKAVRPVVQSSGNLWKSVEIWTGATKNRWKF